MVARKGSRRARWLIVTALAAGVLSALGVVLALAAPWRFVPIGGPNLSGTDTLDTLSADVAVSLDENQAAVVWVEEIESIAQSRGSVWLRRASAGAGDRWSGREAVFMGTVQACAMEAAVAVTGTTAHVVYITWSPCYPGEEDLTETTLYHTTCDLVGGGCAAAQVVTAATSAPNVPPRVREVDVTLDGAGSPHFVYVVYEPTYVTGTIYYREGTAQSDEAVPDSEQGCNPTIAWSGGDVHVVWEDEAEIEIMYNRKEGGESWTHPSTPPSWWQGTLVKRPRNPAVAAQGERVIVVWDWQWTAEADQYVLAYTRYLTETDKWMPMYEVGTQGSKGPLYVSDIGFRDPPYYTYTSTANPIYPVHLYYLQPVVALDREGMPAVVWHADSGTYDVMVSQAQSMTESTAGDTIFSWSEPAVFDRYAGDSASPAVAQAGVVSPSLHVAYVHQVEADWETFYEGRTPGADLDGEHAVYLPIVIRHYTIEGDG
jgi:hypothetical protein